METIAWPFFRREFWTLLKSRKSQTMGLLLLYTLAAVPFLLQNPPPEVAEAIASWFNNGSTFVIFLFVWIDLALNKTMILLGALLSSGIMVDERARNILTLYLSKPIRPESYFASKVLAAILVFTWWYLVTACVAVLTLPYRIPGFHAPTFLAVSSIHLMAGTFTVGLSAVISQSFEKRFSALLASMLTIMLLAGVAFVPFYDRDLWLLGALNPFFHAISIFGELGNMTYGHVLSRLGILLGWNIVVLWMGIQRVAGREA
jgi:ABC-2 type transport system permease protein